MGKYDKDSRSFFPQRLFGWNPLDGPLTPFYRHNVWLMAFRASVCGLCVVIAYMIHHNGVSSGMLPELENSSFQFGEFAVRGYGFPAIFLGVAVVVALWGFGTPAKYIDTADPPNTSGEIPPA